MFFKECDTRLDLLGKVPSASRPVIYMTSGQIAVSVVLVVAGMTWQFARFRPRINNVIGAPLNLESSISKLPGSLDLMNYTSHAETALKELADKCNHKLIGWEVSDFGNDLHQPEDDRIRLPEMFASGAYDELVQQLFSERPKVRPWMNLGDRETKRFTTIHMVRVMRSALRRQDGRAQPIRILSVTAWQDRDVPRSSPYFQSSQARDSRWYFIMFAETAGGPV